MKPALLLFPLVAGIATGAVGTWAVCHGPTLDTSARISPLPRFNETEADVVLSAWRATPALPPDAPMSAQNARRAELRALLARLPNERFPDLLSAQTTRDSNPEIALRRIIFSVWAERDAPAAAAWITAQTNPTFLENSLQDLACIAAKAWSLHDWAAAYAWSTGIAKVFLSDLIGRQLLTQLASTDPQHAISIAQARGTPFWETARHDLLVTWARQDPASAMRQIGVPSPGNPIDGNTFSEAIIHWFIIDPDAAFNWLNRAPATTSADEPSAVVLASYGMPANSPATRNFADRLLAWDGLSAQPQVLADLLSFWHGLDPAAALAWLDSVPDDFTRATLAANMTNFSQPNDPAAGLEIKYRMPAGEHRSDQIQTLLVAWADTDNEAALRWLESHPDSEYETLAKVIEGVRIGNLAATDLPGALDLWRGLTDHNVRLLTASRIARHWAKANPADAADWLLEIDSARSETINPDPGLQSALTLILQDWFASAPAAVLHWLDQRQSHPGSRLAGSAFFQANSTLADAPEPKARARLLATIQDDSLRENLLWNHAWSWLSKDYQAASDWVKSTSGIPPAKIEQLLSSLDPARATP